MKKTQLALAAVALVASTAAMAADVTLSGQIDVGVFHTGKDTAGKGGSFMEQGGLLDHSSVTITANEDLGSGLKAFAVLEAGFNANGYADNGGTNGANQTGTNNPTTLFNRQSFVGLSSDTLGTVGLGKQLSPFILSQALTNFGVGSFWVQRLGVGNAAGAFASVGAGNSAAAFFMPNAVSYTSPSLGGFTARVLTTTTNGTQGNALQFNDPTASSRYDAVSLSGNVGAAFISAAWQQRKDSYKSWTVGGTYAVTDGFSLMANYINDNPEGTGATVKSWAVGAKYALLPGTDAILQYAKGDQDTNAKKLANLTLTHALSKRTTLYGTVANGKNTGSALGNLSGTYTGLSNTSYGVGVAHSF